MPIRDRVRRQGHDGRPVSPPTTPRRRQPNVPTPDEGLDHPHGECGTSSTSTSRSWATSARSARGSARGLTDRTLISPQYLESIELVGEPAPEIRRGWSVPRFLRDYTRSCSRRRQPAAGDADAVAARPGRASIASGGPRRSASNASLRHPAPRRRARRRPDHAERRRRRPIAGSTPSASMAWTERPSALPTGSGVARSARPAPAWRAGPRSGSARPRSRAGPRRARVAAHSVNCACGGRPCVAAAPPGTRRPRAEASRPCVRRAESGTSIRSLVEGRGRSPPIQGDHRRSSWLSVVLAGENGTRRIHAPARWPPGMRANADRVGAASWCRRR